MIGEIFLSKPSYYIIAWILLGIFAALIVYYKKNDLPSWSKWLLGSLRALTISLLGLLLMIPLMKTISTESQKPVVVFAEDHSASTLSDIQIDQNKFEQFANKLSDQYDVERIAFGEKIIDHKDSSALSGTNISAVFKHIEDNFPQELLAATVIASDGIVNQGADPFYAAKSNFTPVYTIPYGDSTTKKDWALSDVLFNQIVYLGDKFEVLVDVSATNLSSASATITLDDLNSKKQIANKTINAKGNRFFETIKFEIEPKSAGLKRYRVKLSSNIKEQNTRNNTYTFTIDVLDARQKVVIVSASPHPDISAIRQALNSDKNFETEYLGNKLDLTKLEKANLIVFHNLPNKDINLSEIEKNPKIAKIGKWYITNDKVDFSNLNNNKSLFKLEPKKNQVNAVTPNLNSTFKLFNIPENWAKTFTSLPPVESPFAEYGKSVTGDVLLTQQIGSITTDYPLLTLGEVKTSKIANFYGNNLWRWRLAEFKINENHDVFDGMITSVARYLSLKADKRKFKSSSSKRIYNTQEQLKFFAELYNDSYELVNEPDVSLKIKDNENKAYNFVFDKSSTGYILDAGSLPSGTYSFVASTTYNGENFTSSGKFSIEEINLEALKTQADWDLLARISDASSGKMIKSSELNKLADDLLASGKAKPILFESVKTRPLIEWPWLLGIILLLLSIEWIIRRRLGTY